KAKVEIVLFKLILSAVRGVGRNPAVFSPLLKKADDLAFLENEYALASLEKIGSGGEDKMKIVQPPMDATALVEADSKLLTEEMMQIRSEIVTLGQIRHMNILPLLAHLARPGCHLLVYEFMKNGSLQDILNDVSRGRRQLDWLARYRIVRGIASGLEYLHMHHSPGVIHTDLKPAKVLLDHDMEARISGFGLAKVFPDAHTHITTSDVVGTAGYIAPEYQQTLSITYMCDIYSFGVLLAGLVMGKLPSDEIASGLDLVKWMRNVMTSENPKRVIDSKLLGNGYEEQMLLVLKTACFCTLDDPKERPNSKDVRCMLSQIQQ
ncbi:hypothetical protein CICLE_v10023893mg, partial [Citrus x clementina]